VILLRRGFVDHLFNDPCGWFVPAYLVEHQHWNVRMTSRYFALGKNDTKVI